MNTAAKVAAAKKRWPEDFCPVPGCLWRVYTSRGVNPCRNHPSEVERNAVACGERPSNGMGRSDLLMTDPTALPPSRPHSLHCQCHKCRMPF